MNRLAVDLLAQQAGERQRLTNLSALSLPAVRAYLDGQVALRQGRWDDAIQRFTAALDVDSTFAQAALGLAEAGDWSVAGDGGRGGPVAWAYRDRLSPGDRALLLVQVGPHHPALSTMAEMIAAAERGVKAMPDQPAAWFILGDRYYHWGAAIGLSHARQLAATAFRHAIALDSSITHIAPNAEPLTHLFQIAAMDGDTATVRRFSAPVAAVDSGPGSFAWRAAWVFHDSSAIDAMHARFAGRERERPRGCHDANPRRRAPGGRGRTCRRGAGSARDDAAGADPRALRPLHGRDERRPSRRGGGRAQRHEPGASLYHGITGALYWDGDTAFARATARAGAARADAPLTRVPAELSGRFWDTAGWNAGAWRRASWPR